MYKIDDFNRSNRRLQLFEKAVVILIYIIIIPIIIINITLIIKSIINPYKTPDILGYKSFIIVSESMEDTIMTGDAIIVKEVKENELKNNDIITFREGNETNTHRIVEISNELGQNTYTTKGDNNKKVDKNKLMYEQIEGKYILRIKGFGKMAEILKSKITLVCLLIILVGISIFQSRITKKKLIRKQKRYKYENS